MGGDAAGAARQAGRLDGLLEASLGPCEAVGALMQALPGAETQPAVDAAARDAAFEGLSTGQDAVLALDQEGDGQFRIHDAMKARGTDKKWRFQEGGAG